MSFKQGKFIPLTYDAKSTARVVRLISCKTEVVWRRMARKCYRDKSLW